MLCHPDQLVYVSWARVPLHQLCSCEMIKNAEIELAVGEQGTLERRLGNILLTWNHDS